MLRSRSWGKPRHLLMGETPKTAMAPQDRAALRTTRVLDNLSVPYLLAKCCINQTQSNTVRQS